MCLTVNSTGKFSNQVAFGLDYDNNQTTCGAKCSFSTAYMSMCLNSNTEHLVIVSLVGRRIWTGPQRIGLNKRLSSVQFDFLFSKYKSNTNQPSDLIRPEEIFSYDTLYRVYPKNFLYLLRAHCFVTFRSLFSRL